MYQKVCDSSITDILFPGHSREGECAVGTFRGEKGISVVIRVCIFQMSFSIFDPHLQIQILSLCSLCISYFSLSSLVRNIFVDCCVLYVTPVNKSCNPHWPPWLHPKRKGVRKVLLCRVLDINVVGHLLFEFFHELNI